MTAPYSPRGPKRLERSRTNKIFGGVCAGTAEYLNMDPTLVRVLTVILTLITGVPIAVYLVMLFIVPEEGAQPPVGYPPVQPGRPVDQTIWGTAGAPWEQRRPEPTAPSEPEAPVVPPPTPADPWRGDEPGDPNRR